jgi:cyclopropane-fatty-acyl-phospholipid synthase
LTAPTDSTPAWLEALAASRGFRVRLPGGGEIGPDSASFTIVVRSENLLRRIARLPSPLLLGQAWLDGSLDLEGDLHAAMRAMHELETAVPTARFRALGVLRTLVRPWRTAARDVASHYDLPPEFFGLFLDSRLVYTCAYYSSAGAGLEQAQAAKLELVCRKLRLTAGERLLDLGCGWGALAIHAASAHGARVHAVTLSARQARYGADLVQTLGLADRVQVDHLDWRAVPAGDRYDKIAAIGMIEHLGRAAYPGYFARVRDWLAPGGLFLNHGITMRRGAVWTSEMEFLDRHVFPGLDLVDVSATTGAMEDAGLEVLDVENLRPHYARTTREWADRLWARREEAVAIAGERAWRTFVAYLAAASVAFEAGWIGLHQVVAQGAGAPDDGRLPMLRESFPRE